MYFSPCKCPECKRHSYKDVQITGFSNMPADIKPGHVFSCEQVTAEHDGHRHVAQAVAAGAALVIAKLDLPGAELAMCVNQNDDAFDPGLPQFKELYNADQYRLAANDKLILETAAEEIERAYAKVEVMAGRVGLDDTEKEFVRRESGLRVVSSALNYNFDHWGDPTSAHQILPA
jgi:UDP-N-acetylmuramyl pentapeptide synthase